MSQEIVEAIIALEQEKGIESEVLMGALEEALLSAYRKTPSAARYARVDLDRDTADFRVFELILPPELEEQLLQEVVDEEQEIDPETGELMHTGCMVPVYPRLENMYQKSMRRMVHEALDAITVDGALAIPDPAPQEAIAELHLMPYGRAVSQIHSPNTS